VTGGSGAGSSRERRKRGRLSRSGDFDRVYREGRSHANRFLVLYAFPRSREGGDGEETRLGISVSRKVGGAVERNAVKRALREAFWSLDRELPASHDFVLVARPDLAGLIERDGTGGVTTALRELAAEAGLMGAAG
jgi:ribonuclease P protein component